MIRIIVRFIVLVLAKIFYHHKVYGKEHLEKGSGIVAPNHCSFLDPPIIGISCPEAVHFLARQSLFHPRAFAWFLRQLNTHPVARGKGNIHTFKTAMELLLSGKKVIIFPEGMRSLNGQLQQAQAGVAMLVLKTKCKVIPTYVHGTFLLWNAKQKFPKLFGKTACVFGKPLDFTALGQLEKKEAHLQIANIIMLKIAQLRDWYLAGAKGSPP